MKGELPEQLQFIANSRAIQKTSGASMRGKVCVVTGSTSGVGLEAVRRLARGGADIVMVCRDRRTLSAHRRAHQQCGHALHHAHLHGRRA